MAPRDRLIPIIVASPLFLQNLDTSIMATALPSIAAALNVEALHLNLAITSYLLSLAVFLPVSGWLAERFGPKRVFCCAIGFFSLGSTLCGLANSLPELVAFRMLQGLGGAMMVPVGRLILLRSVPPAQMVAAMVWFTVPATIGRMIGPLVGGAIVTLASWRWIFLINVPFGLLGIAMAAWFVPDLREENAAEPFDAWGFAMLALGLTAILGALETIGKNIVPGWQSAAAIAAGVLSLLAYWRRSRKKTAAIIDLAILKYPTYRASIVGGVPLRLAIGASPFLLPLMLQLGFGLSPLNSGLLTVAAAVGALATRTLVAQAIRRAGFRSLVIGSTVCTCIFYTSYGLFTPDTSHVLMFFVMMGGGLVNSMAMVALQTLGYSDIPKPRQSHAATLSSMVQQLSLSLGVVMGASLVTAAALWQGGDPAHLTAANFSPAFFVIGAITLLSLFVFRRLKKEDGASLR